MKTERLVISIVAVALMVILSSSFVLGQSPLQGVETVVYFRDKVTTFTEIFESGIVVHCTDSGPSVVRCYNTEREANAEFARAYPEKYRHSRLNPLAEIKENSSRSISNYFSLYAGHAYTTFIKDIYYSDYNPPVINSVLEQGAAAMKFWKGVPGNNCSGVSWIVGESHYILLNGWGSGGTKCIHWLG